MENKHAFAKAVRYARATKQIRQSEASALCNIPLGLQIAIEKGTLYPSHHVLASLVEALELDMEPVLAEAEALFKLFADHPEKSEVFSLRLKNSRKLKGLSQRGLAKALGTHIPEVMFLERKLALPTSELLWRLADFLETSPNWLIDDETVEIPKPEMPVLPPVKEKVPAVSGADERQWPARSEMPRAALPEIRWSEDVTGKQEGRTGVMYREHTDGLMRLLADASVKRDWELVKKTAELLELLDRR